MAYEEPTSAKGETDDWIEREMQPFSPGGWVAGRPFTKVLRETKLPDASLPQRQRTFRYPPVRVIQLSGGAVLFSVLFAGMTAANLIVSHYLSAAMFACCTAFFAAFAPGLILSTSSIVLNEYGLSSVCFGVCTERFRWEDVLFIRKSNLISRPPDINEYVDIVADERRTNWIIKNAFGTIRATDHIKDYKRLLDFLNEYADAYSIERRIVNEEAIRAAGPRERTGVAKGASVGRL